mmetsp:Transcript_5608/g.16532  ORF Transcript_5608/g.16532 Transcript_5608/m.16532 type:complete len:307 (+) Transcript_5608:780-1700(+)
MRTETMRHVKASFRNETTGLLAIAVQVAGEAEADARSGAGFDAGAPARVERFVQRSNASCSVERDGPTKKTRAGGRPPPGRGHHGPLLRLRQGLPRLPAGHAGAARGGVGGIPVFAQSRTRRMVARRAVRRLLEKRDILRSPGTRWCSSRRTRPSTPPPSGTSTRATGSTAPSTGSCAPSTSGRSSSARRSTARACTATTRRRRRGPSARRRGAPRKHAAASARVGGCCRLGARRGKSLNAARAQVRRAPAPQHARLHGLPHPLGAPLPAQSALGAAARGAARRGVGLLAAAARAEGQRRLTCIST